MVDPTRIELVISACKAEVIPFNYRPIRNCLSSCVNLIPHLGCGVKDFIKKSETLHHGVLIKFITETLVGLVGVEPTMQKRLVYSQLFLHWNISPVDSQFNPLWLGSQEWLLFFRGINSRLQFCYLFPLKVVLAS